MDSITIQRHIRINIEQLDEIVGFFGNMGLRDEITTEPIVTLRIKTIMFMWYLSNKNCFRELADKFNVAVSWSHTLVVRCLQYTAGYARDKIRWPNACEKRRSSDAFEETSRLQNIIGCIDGCHIRIRKPVKRGQDYMNRKDYYSVILQGICNNNGVFIDVFIGVSGRVHDARVLRLSPLYADWQNKMGQYQLLGDSAYCGADFPFIRTGTRDYGNLTREQKVMNKRICSARVIIENTFGRLKCRFRCLKELENTNMENTVSIILACCCMHNICSYVPHDCIDHPDGCPPDEGYLNNGPGMDNNI